MLLLLLLLLFFSSLKLHWTITFPWLGTNTNTLVYLRWLKTVSSTYIWMSRYNHSLSLDATIMVSKNCSIIGEHVVIILLETVLSHLNTYTPLNRKCLSFLLPFHIFKKNVTLNYAKKRVIIKIVFVVVALSASKQHRTMKITRWCWLFN